jgi:hypothetical protein
MILTLSGFRKYGKETTSIFSAPNPSQTEDRYSAVMSVFFLPISSLTSNIIPNSF